MARIFISYRRADSRKDTGRLYDRLAPVFGHDNIFRDVDDIPLGSDFRGKIREAVASCDIVLAVIGRQWLTVKNEDGQRRLDNPDDFVRIELETGLQRDTCIVIPVLVDGANMPKDGELPPSLRELSYKQAHIVRDDPDFHRDVDKLIQGMQRLGPTPTHTSPSTSAARVRTSQFDVHGAITEFYRVQDAQDWDEARRLLALIRESGRAPRFFDVDTQEKGLWDQIQAAEAAAEYELLRLVAKRSTPGQVRKALHVFWESHPGYDPANIRGTLPRVSDILPPPFEWIEIPAGRVSIDKHGDFDVPAFEIAKYPITNAQYAKFLDAGGYRERQWWTAAGWQQRQNDGWTEPRYWTDSKWNGAEYPVVGVSWYEAVAFCQWLSEVSGEAILLPTEQQWQRAAQGDDGPTYPWGNEWDGERCNNSVSPHNSKQTTPVRQYEGPGNSPFGVVDLAGNVWEWCLTDYENGTSDVNSTAKYRVLRGGSWYVDNSGGFRAAYRTYEDPHSRGNRGLGFRCARSR